jgi:hypothetical protein
MGTYGISTQEFLEGHLYPTKKDDGESYSFEDFLSDFEGDVCAEVVAEAFNKLSKKYKWNEKLRVEEK